MSDYISGRATAGDIERNRWGGPSPWAGKDSRTPAQKRDDEPGNIRAEIIRLSAKLPMDDPLRIAIACAPLPDED